MNIDSSGEITSILEAMKAGEVNASAQLFSLVYEELKLIAKNRIHGERWSTQTTALVHEAYLKLVKKQESSWSDRHHFFWAASRAMRDILVDRARREASVKRGGKLKRADLTEQLESDSTLPLIDLLDLNDALERMSSIHPEAAKIVQLKYFAGLTHEQIADLLSLSRSAVWRQWEFARAWLANELGVNKLDTT